MKTEVAQTVQRMRAERQTELPGMTLDRGRTVQRVSPEPSRGPDMNRQRRGAKAQVLAAFIAPGSACHVRTRAVHSTQGDDHGKPRHP